MNRPFGYRIAWSLGALLALASAPASATPYWVSYEGDIFPEQAGWLHHFGDENGPLQGGAQRSVDNGILTLDGLRNDQIFDFNEIQRQIDPGPGETFVAEWRVFVDPRSDPRDVGVGIVRDNPPGKVFFKIGPTTLWVSSDHVSIALEPNLFHSFAFLSDDMQHYELVIDGSTRYASEFDTYTILHSFVNFGDGTQGQRSLSKWDYFRFGVVPEPCMVAVVLLGAALMGRTRMRRRSAQTRRRREENYCENAEAPRC